MLIRPALPLLVALIGTPAALAIPPAADGAAPPEATWAHWRGPHGTGVAVSDAPLRWSDDENVRWQREIPGRGFSTPIAWGDRLFLTTAVPADGADAPAEEGGDSWHGGGGAYGPRDYVVLCLDRNTGTTLWQRTATTATPHEGYHRNYGSFASASPVTDGERLVVSFGSNGLYAYDLDGARLWSFDPGVKMQMRAEFGEGTAPALHGDTVVQVYDHEGASFIAALDATSGAERWRRSRDEPSTWATPLITEHDGRVQVIASGTTRVRSYDLKTGEIIWECGGLGLNAIPVPMRIDDLVIVMSGYRDANIMAVRLGGSGDITGTDRVVWSSQRGAAYTCSPVLADGLLYTTTDRGMLSCFDARTGTPHYVEQRLPRGTSLKASPVAAGGRLYIADESGNVHIVKLGTQYELVRTNTLADAFFVSSPIVVDGSLYLRSREKLYCIGAASSPAAPD